MSNQGRIGREEITEAEVSLAQRMGEPESEDGNPVDEAAVREASNRLPQLQAELAKWKPIIEAAGVYAD